MHAFTTPAPLTHASTSIMLFACESDICRVSRLHARLETASSRHIIEIQARDRTIDELQAENLQQFLEMRNLEGTSIPVMSMDYLMNVTEAALGGHTKDNFTSAWTGLTRPELAILLQLLSAVNFPDLFLGQHAGVVAWDDAVAIYLVRNKTDLTFEQLEREFKVLAHTVGDVYKKTGILIRFVFEHTIAHEPTQAILDKHRSPHFKDGWKKDIYHLYDGFYLRMDAPHDPELNKESYLAYIKDHALKAMIDLGSDGKIRHVTDFYGAHASEGSIVEEDVRVCKDKFDITIFKKGEVVVTDKGVLISELCASMGAMHVTPAYLLDRTLTSAELEHTEDVARTRSHNERAMELLRRFKILRSRIRMDMMGYISDTLFNCAFLTHFMAAL